MAVFILLVISCKLKKFEVKEERLGEKEIVLSLHSHLWENLVLFEYLDFLSPYTTGNVIYLLLPMSVIRAVRLCYSPKLSLDDSICFQWLCAVK